MGETSDMCEMWLGMQKSHDLKLHQARKHGHDPWCRQMVGMPGPKLSVMTSQHSDIDFPRDAVR